MKPKIFIDGSEGTTGLQIHERLSGRADIDLLQIEQSKRKDINERKKILNAADLVFICLPDEAARETVTLIENENTRIIDASSAHRVANEWTYGLPEMSKTVWENIKKARRVSNPGCHSTGAILLLAPLVRAGDALLVRAGVAPLAQAGIMPHDIQVTITSITGYTGGGKSMISQYEEADREPSSEYNAPRLYSATAQHKHIPEIMKHAGISVTPAFMPIVADYPQGMQVIIPLILPGKRREVHDTLAKHYADCKNIDVSDISSAFAPSNVNAGSDRVALKVLGHGDIVLLTAQFDNLGKGASGAAVQNMNIMLGFNEYKGLRI